MLNPLSKIKEIQHDADLTVPQAHILTMMVLKADNDTGRVRQSQKNIADLAGVNERTVRRAWSEPAVSKYFHSVVETGRWVHINLNTGLSARNERYYDSESGEVKVRATGLSVTDTGLSVHDTGHRVRPSTLSSTSYSTQDNASAPASPRVTQQRLKEQGEVAKPVEPSLVSISNPPAVEVDSLPSLEEGSPDTESGIINVDDFMMKVKETAKRSAYGKEVMELIEPGWRKPRTDESALDYFNAALALVKESSW